MTKTNAKPLEAIYDECFMDDYVVAPNGQLTLAELEGSI